MRYFSYFGSLAVLFSLNALAGAQFQKSTFADNLKLLESVTSKGRYLKVSHAGLALPETATLGAKATDWACTYDVESRLIWEVKTTDKGLHDKDWKYTWFDSSKPAGEQQGVIGIASNTNCVEGVRCDTEKFVQAVNGQGLCGAKNWRLPSLEELKTLVKCREVDTSFFGCKEPVAKPTIDTVYFPNTLANSSAPNQYYSATPYDEQIGNFAAWSTNFDLGSNGFVGPVNNLLVRVVRTGRPLANVVNYDAKTGRLSLSAVQVGTQVYSAELQDKGGYQFQLLKATLVTNDETLQFPEYQAESGLLTIPYLAYLNQGYQVYLQNTNGVFVLTQANPL